jgi:hypothetical protein
MIHVQTTTERTLPEKILLAAYALEEGGQSPFTAEALTVRVWERFPRTFGLRGFHDRHPDSNKVLTSLMGEKGLAKRGWLAKVGQKLYELTHKGRQVVRQLLQAPEGGNLPDEPIRLDPADDRLLQQLLDGPAVDKYRHDRREDWTFADACRFWGLTEAHHGPAVDHQVEMTQARIADCARRIGLGEAVLSNGRCVTADDTTLLDEVHESLHDRFTRHLALLRHRRMQR